MITRDPASSLRFSNLIRSFEAHPVLLPLFELKSVVGDLKKNAPWLKDIHIVVFTSQNAVRFLFEGLGGAKLNDAVKYFCVGQETVKACSSYGVTSVYAPNDPKTAEELFLAMTSMINLKNKHILYPRAKKIRSRLSHHLVSTGAILHEWVAYENVFRESAVAEFTSIKKQPIDWVCFFSPSAVTSFLKVLARSHESQWLTERSVKIASIGKVTSRELLNVGLLPSVECNEPSSRQMVEKMLEWETQHAKIL